MRAFLEGRFAEGEQLGLQAVALGQERENSNAAQLFALVHKHGYAQTKVIVHNGSKGNEPAVARRSPSGSSSHVASARPAQRNGYRLSRYNRPY